MEFLIFILVLIVLATVAMPWINHFRLMSKHDEIKKLKIRLEHVEEALYFLLNPEEAEKYKAKEAKKESFFTEKGAEEGSVADSKSVGQPHSSVPQTTSAQSSDWIKTAQESFEKNIASKIPVWIGALSLIFAAFFLVKYSIELGWMKPIVRVSLGTLFGILLLIGGQWVMKRTSIANFQRISQGLVGAGLSALYVSIYASLHLYDLLPPLIGFGAMAVVTGLAVVLSLRHGQPIAVFGLLGGLLTPIFVGSDEPNALSMFVYLFLFFSAMFSVLVRKGWWILAILTVLGVFAWSAIWFIAAFSASDAIVLVIFALGIAGVVLAVTGRYVAEGNIPKESKIQFHTLNFAAILGGVATIGWISFEVSLTLFDWSVLNSVVKLFCSIDRCT